MAAASLARSRRILISVTSETTFGTVRIMVNVSLLEFFRTGRFGPIELGMRRQEVMNLIGGPDDFGLPPTHPMQAAVWLYGDMEFHFSKDKSRLFLIWCDHIPFPGKKSGRVNLDAWLFAKGKQPNKKELENGLKTADIRYQYHERESKAVGRLSFLPDKEGKVDKGNLNPIAGEPWFHYLSTEATGAFLLESGVEIGMGQVNEFHKETPMPAVEGSLTNAIQALQELLKHLPSTISIGYLSHEYQ